MCEITYQQFKYNVKTGRLSESYQYGSDSNGNVNTLFNLSCYTLTDGSGKEVGYVSYNVSATSINSTPNFYDSPQKYLEIGAFHITDVGTFTSTLSYTGETNIFTPGLRVPTILAGTGFYYNKVNAISIQANSDGTRDVWISLKN